MLYLRIAPSTLFGSSFFFASQTFRGGFIGSNGGGTSLTRFLRILLKKAIVLELKSKAQHQQKVRSSNVGRNRLWVFHVWHYQTHRNLYSIIQLNCYNFDKSNTFSVSLKTTCLSYFIPLSHCIIRLEHHKRPALLAISQNFQTLFKRSE